MRHQVMPTRSTRQAAWCPLADRCRIADRADELQSEADASRRLDRPARRRSAAPDQVLDRGLDYVPRDIALGATEVHWDKRPPDADYVILADPEGNRFCVIDAG